MIPKRRVVLKRNWCVASGGKQLSIQAFLPRLVASAPILTGVCLLVVFSMSIALQGAELLRVVRTPATLPTNSTIPTIAPISEASTSQLFGVHQLADNDPPPATNLQLTLLGILCTATRNAPVRSSSAQSIQSIQSIQSSVTPSATR